MPEKCAHYAGSCLYSGWCSAKGECYTLFIFNQAKEQRAEAGRECPSSLPSIPDASAINLNPWLGNVPEVGNADVSGAASVASTLEERGSRYGEWKDNAAVSQSLKKLLKENKNYHLLSLPHKEALEMIAQKIARILNGDAHYKDNWHDIAGYATLGENSCVESARKRM